jgi:hypothetical protein
LGQEPVRSHLKKAQAKLGGNDNAHAVAQAIRLQLIPEVTSPPNRGCHSINDKPPYDRSSCRREVEADGTYDGKSWSGGTVLG